jgi:branched-chain amino acid transport system permease protein
MTRSTAVRLLPGVAASAAVVAGALVLPPHLVTILSLVFISALLASSVDLLAGQAGLVSIGHAGISGAAAYAVAWATLHDHGAVVALLLALVVTVGVSTVYGLTTMRTSGIVFLMITLALGIVVFGLALKLSSITGGQNGLTGIRRPAFLTDPTAFYLVTAGCFALAAGARHVLARSPFGLVLRGTRESETRMSSLGYSVARAKFVAVLLSGLVAGLAGVLVVWQAQFLSPNVASFSRSAMAVVMVIVGGAGWLLGPLVGATVVVGTEHWLSSYVERWPTLLGLVFIAVVLFAPGGIVGAVSGRRRGRSGDRRPTAGHGPAPLGPPLLEDELSTLAVDGPPSETH